MAQKPLIPIADELFAGGGEMGERMRALDWSKTPLGPVDTWPQSLKTAVSICLNSRFAILVWWGPTLVKLYNDAYVQLIGSKHPKALGAQGREVWPEIWDTIGPMLKGVLERGEASWADNLLLLLERDGYPEECYFTFSYSPIRDESGGVGGVFTPVVETTDAVIGARRLRTLRELAAISVRRSENAKQACCAAAGKVLSANTYDLPFAAIYLFDKLVGNERSRATLAAGTPSETEAIAFPPKIDFQNKDWLSSSAVARGEICILDLAATKLEPLPQAPWGVAPTQAIVVPIAHQHAEPFGFFLAGISIRKQLDENYREFYARIAGEIAGIIRKAEALEKERQLRAEAEMERAKMHELLIHAPAGIAILSGPQHRFTLLNRNYLDIVARESMDDLVGKGVIEAFPELAGQGIQQYLDQVYQTGVPFVANELFLKVERSATGLEKEGFYNFVYQPIRNPEGQIEGIFVLVIEITEQVLARREIETREEQFRVLADSIPQLAWMANADGALFWYNQRWYEYTGTTWEQMKDWGWQSVHDPAILPLVLERYHHSLEVGEPFDMVFPLRGADGKFRSFLTRALPVRNPSGTIVRWFGTNTDVEAQQKAEAALRQSEKLAAVGRLASSIAHEINNPLEGVTNLVYLARTTAVNAETKAYLETAEQELERVSQIANQTLRFHKQQSAATATDVPELLDSVLALYRGKFSYDNIQLMLQVVKCPPLVCYAGEIRQVVANLIGNALDAMPKGGILCVRVRPITHWRNYQSAIRLTIADTGHGMSPETKRHIYEPFFTTKGEVGTGLGLWVSSGIVEKHHGSIHVRSSVQPGKSGTVFTLTLPYKDEGI